MQFCFCGFCPALTPAVLPLCVAAVALSTWVWLEELCCFGQQLQQQSVNHCDTLTDRDTDVSADQTELAVAAHC